MATLQAELPAVGAQPAFREYDRLVLIAVLVATTAIVTGAIWDISWHMTIGRDSLWSAPHLLEQFGAALAGLACGAYVLWLTFRAPEAARARTVRFWGFRGPLGAWVCIWGSLAMIASVPFDNWWHGAYGLDVQILSLPHTVLMTGVLGIQLGTLLFALAGQNRADTSPGLSSRAYTYATGILILMFGLAGYEYIGYANEWQRSGFYRITASIFPFLLLGVARASRLRWPATFAAGTYMGIMLATSWILQLVPAEPRLAPILNPVDRMVPLAFPLVLIAPAIVIDLLEHRFRERNAWLHAALAAPLFVLVMLAVHWPFGEFMLSPLARNHLFYADQWPYIYQVGEWSREFWRLDTNDAGAWSAANFSLGLLAATVQAFISARLGLWWGNFTRRVLR